jgi:hypothetical protein
MVTVIFMQSVMEIALPVNFFTTYFDFSELISLNNEKLLRFDLTFVQFSKLNLIKIEAYMNRKNVCF